MAGGVFGGESVALKEQLSRFDLVSGIPELYVAFRSAPICWVVDIVRRKIHACAIGVWGMRNVRTAFA